MGLEEILIIVKTYPEISAKYTETVCTGGILKETKQLIRIYPIRYRYLDGANQFNKYQWISARLDNPFADTRPESHTIVESSIVLKDEIGTAANWNERKKWVLNDNNVFSSVEELKTSQQKFRTSLGLVRPKKIMGCKIKNKSATEIQQAEKKKESILRQGDFFEEKKDLETLPIKIALEFECDDPKCSGHKMSILDWEFGQLYRKVKNTKDWKKKISDKVSTICGPNKDTYLILGNMANYQHIFCILGFFYPTKEKQLSLF